MLGELDLRPGRAARGQTVATQGVVQSLIQIQPADRIAILVWLGSLDALAAGARGGALMPLALTQAKIGEDFHEGLALHFRDGAGRQAEFALAILVEHAVLEKLLE